MSLKSIAQCTAAKVYFSELAAARALGYPGVDAYVSAFRAMDETYERAFAADRPGVLTRLKMIGGKI